MKTNRSNLQIILLLFVFALSRPALGADGERTHQIWYNPHSGITGSAWTYVPVAPTPWSPPNPPEPLRYYGTFSIFSDSGRFVTKFATSGIFASFTVHLKPGIYVVVPDDPAFRQFRTVVTVRFKEFTDVVIYLPIQ